ncbi:MAG: hypothetical protein MK098_14675 [Marinovum sp.]|nr:hypothetical protein [Marinovum sp.]
MEGSFLVPVLDIDDQERLAKTCPFGTMSNVGDQTPSLIRGKPGAASE